MKKKKLLIIIIGAIIVAGIIGTCTFTGISVFKGSMQMVNNEDTCINNAKIHLKKKGFDLVKFKSKYTINTIQIKSTLGGHTIPADYITVNGDKNADTVIIVHRMGGNRLTVYPMAKMFTGIPVNFMMSMGNITTKIKLGFSYEDANVCNYMNNTKVPVLIINSKTDELSPYFMGEDIYNSITHNNKKIFTVEDSKHADVFFDYPDEYESNIIEFIKQLS